VIDALVRYYERDNSNVHRGLHALSMRATDAYEGARARVARFINAADPAEVLFTRGTTESINLVARSWGHAHLKAGDVVLTTEFEHHSNLVPWQQAAKASGATLKYVPLLGVDGEGGLDLAALDKLLTPQVKLFAFTHISNTLGTINPVAELCRRARAVGAVTVIDAAQSIGHAPLDVQAIGCDFLAFSGHKMCGPTGIGVLYGRRALLDKLAPDETGGGMVVSVTYEGATWKPAPERFEAGTPNVAGAIGLGAACDYLDALGRDKIAAHDDALASLAMEKLSPCPASASSARASGRAQRPRELRLRRRARARHRDLRRRGRRRPPRRPPLQPAADAQARPHEHDPREFLPLQHRGGNRPPRRRPPPHALRVGATLLLSLVAASQPARPTAWMVP
jgi:cysteine desulfurase/selenocysteine lyase